MKKKFIISGLVILLSVGLVILVFNVTSKKSVEQTTSTEELNSSISYGTKGSHCSGTVGCSCSGFAPITNGDVWQQSYCRKCGHHRNYHH